MHLEHETSLAGVGAAGERGADVDEPDPDAVAHPVAGAARAREQREERMVRREQCRLQRRVEVDVEQEAPDLGRRLGGRTEGLADLEPPGRDPVLPGRELPVDGVRLHRPVELEHDEALRVRLLLVRHASAAKLPPSGRAPEEPWTFAHDRFPDGRKELASLGRHEPRPPAPHEGPRVGAPLALDPDLARPRCYPVAEPAVDRLLARPQGCKRLAALVDVAQLYIHQRAQHSTPPVRR